MRRKEERKKQGQTNNKAKQHSTSKATCGNGKIMFKYSNLGIHVTQYCTVSKASLAQCLQHIQSCNYTQYARVEKCTWVRIPPETAYFFFGKVTALGVLCCFALLFV